MMVMTGIQRVSACSPCRDNNAYEMERHRKHPKDVDRRATHPNEASPFETTGCCRAITEVKTSQSEKGE